MKIIKYIVIALIALIVLFVVGAGILVATVDPNDYKELITCLSCSTSLPIDTTMAAVDQKDGPLKHQGRNKIKNQTKKTESKKLLAMEHKKKGHQQHNSASSINNMSFATFVVFLAIKIASLI